MVEYARRELNRDHLLLDWLRRQIQFSENHPHKSNEFSTVVLRQNICICLTNEHEDSTYIRVLTCYRDHERMAPYVQQHKLMIMIIRIDGRMLCLTIK